MTKRYSRESLAMFTEAWLLLAKARLMLVSKPFNKIVPVLQGVKGEPRAADMELLKLVQLSIARAAKRSPWRTKCFEQALAARMMLGRRGIATTTYFGVLKNQSDQMEAHAWLKCGEFVVTGRRRMNEYQIVGTF